MVRLVQAISHARCGAVNPVRLNGPTRNEAIAVMTAAMARLKDGRSSISVAPRDIT
jgi:hypothetical protein